MASWRATARRTGGQSSNVASSRAGGGSPSEQTRNAPQAGLLARPMGFIHMRKELRLRRRKDFDNVFRQGRSWNNELLVLRSLPNDLPHNRYGFITSKRLGKAVVRNRVRRRVREAVRVLPLANSWDIVISAKAKAAEVDFQRLRAAVVELLVKAGLLSTEAQG